MTTYLVYGAPRGAEMHAIDFAKLVDAAELVTAEDPNHATRWASEDSAKELIGRIQDTFPEWKFEVRKQG